jgi:hypothetical protein
MKKKIKIILGVIFIGLAPTNLQALKLYAIGDVHGDYKKIIHLLKKLRLIDKNHNWIGGEDILVQVGDQIDKGNDDRKVIDLFEKLSKQAEAQHPKGYVFSLLGNHEIMNSHFDFKAVKYKAAKDFDEFGGMFYKLKFSPFKHISSSIRKELYGRAAAFAPGGPYAKILSKRKAILKWGPILFVHGGLIPQYARLGIDNLNDEINHWLIGSLPKFPKWALASDSPFWSREFSKSIITEDGCKILEETLKITETKFMVVGHTPHPLKGINSACNGLVWRIDTGMSKGSYNGTPQALVFDPIDNTFQIITAK